MPYQIYGKQNCQKYVLRQYLSEKCYLSLQYGHIHTYISYAWGCADAMRVIYEESATSAFLSKFKKPLYLYPTTFFNVSYIRPAYNLNKFKQKILIRGSYLWNEFQTEKEIEVASSFKIVVKKS